MSNVDDWPDWKKLLAKLAILWCALSGLFTLLWIVFATAATIIRRMAGI